MFFVMSLRLPDHKVLHNVASSSSFLLFRLVFSLFSLVFRTSKFWSLIKQLLFHSHLLDMRLVIANSPRWLFTISYPTRARGIIVNHY